VVCPDAEVKLFITATPEERARRRHRELLTRGEQAEYETILADIRRRDERDMSRSTAPLKAAADAMTLDTTHLDADGAFQAALDLVEGKRS
jgi:cytidylate kinase